MIYVGIDNGVSGSIGVIGENFYNFLKTPVISELDYTKVPKNITRLNVDALVDILSELKNTGERMIVALERPMVNPGRFIATASALRCHEATLIVLQMLKISYFYIDSKEWQKEFFSKEFKGEALKTASLKTGTELFPGTSPIKHPDRDGLLIAEYYRRKKLYESKV